MDDRTAKPDRRGRAALAAVALAAALGTAIGLNLAVGQAHRTQTPTVGQLSAQISWPAGARAAPGFRLRDQTGRIVTLRSLRGRPVLLTFLDSHCKQACPLEARALADVQRLSAHAQAELVVVSVDPWADTAASVRSFGRESRWRGDWHWLLGARSELAPVWRRYNIAVIRGTSDIGHSTALYLIDGTGGIRSGYLFPFSPLTVAHDVRVLAAAHNA